MAAASSKLSDYEKEIINQEAVRLRQECLTECPALQALLRNLVSLHLDNQRLRIREKDIPFAVTRSASHLRSNFKRLREALANHYQRCEGDPPIRITFRRGDYRPVIEHSESWRSFVAEAELLADHRTRNGICQAIQVLEGKPDLHKWTGAMLAELYLRKAKYADPIGAVPQGMEAARQHAAQAAREIKSARSMATLGMILLASERTTKDAADWFEQARSSDPQIEISYEYTTYLVARGFHQEAIQRSLAAIAAGHQIKMHSLNLGEIYYIAGQHDKAVGQLQRARKLYPDSWVPPSLLGLAALTQRQYLRASRWFYIGSKVSGSGSRRRLFQDVRGWLGDLMHAKRPAGTGMERTSTLRGAGVDVLCEAVIALVFGNLARCLYLLELLAEHEYPTLTWSIQWPIFEPLRQDPRYVALRRRLQVPARSSGPLLSHRTS